MAQLKDLLVNGDAKVLGTLYTDEIGNNLTIDGGLKISGRVLGSGDDEGLVIGQCNNGYAGLILGSPNGLRSVFYLNSSNQPVWRFNDGSSGVSYDISHPKKAGTIALTSDIPTSVSINLNGAAVSNPSFYAPVDAGTSGYVLKSNGANVAPSWTSATLTDTKVTQSAAFSTSSATSGNYPVILAYSTATTATTNTVNKSASFLYNPHGTTGGLSILNTTPSSSTTTGALKVSGGIGCAGNIYAAKVYGAVWNDYAECRAQKEEIEPGYCVASGDDGKVYKTNEKFQACDGIVSDTFGFSIGETDECKTPLAVAGRVLAYAENPEELHSGDTVCAGPNGKVVKMTREEIREWPDRIVGIVSEIPTYETWGTGGVLVDGRIWIKVK